jgi:acid phosphatase
MLSWLLIGTNVAIAAVAAVMLLDPLVIEMDAHRLPLYPIFGLCALSVVLLVASLVGLIRSRESMRRRAPWIFAFQGLLGLLLASLAVFGTAMHSITAVPPVLGEARRFPSRTPVVRLALLGDSGAPNKESRAIVAWIVEAHQREPFDGVFLLGDNIYQSQVSNPERGFEEAIEGTLGPLFEAGIGVHSLLGNHDFDRPEYAERQLSDPRLGMDGRLYDDVRIGAGPVGTHLFLLEAELAMISTPMSEWFANGLAATNAPWKIVLCHKPAVDARGGNPMVAALLEASDLAGHRVLAKIAGDTHNYQRHRTADGVFHLVNGGASKSRELEGDLDPIPEVSFDETESFLIIELREGIAKFRAFAWDGRIVDEFEAGLPASRSHE